MRQRLDMDKIASRLGAERMGSVRSGGGYFCALELAADVQSRFKTPSGGGRSTDPSWSLRRQIPLTEHTLRRLEELVETMREQGQVSVEPMQLAAILLEKATEQAIAQDLRVSVERHLKP